MDELEQVIRTESVSFSYQEGTLAVSDASIHALRG